MMQYVTNRKMLYNSMHCNGWRFPKSFSQKINHY